MQWIHTRPVHRSMPSPMWTRRFRSDLDPSPLKRVPPFGYPNPVMPPLKYNAMDTYTSRSQIYAITDVDQAIQIGNRSEPIEASAALRLSKSGDAAAEVQCNGYIHVPFTDLCHHRCGPGDSDRKSIRAH